MSSSSQEKRTELLGELARELRQFHRIEAKAEKRVDKQYLEEVKKVEGKPRLL